MLITESNLNKSTEFFWECFVARIKIDQKWSTLPYSMNSFTRSDRKFLRGLKSKRLPSKFHVTYLRNFHNEKFFCHSFKRRMSMKTCFSKITADCISPEEYPLVFRLICNFVHEKYAAWYLWRKFYRFSRSYNGEILAQYGSIISSICLKRSNFFCNSVHWSVLIGWISSGIFPYVFSEEVSWA